MNQLIKEGETVLVSINLRPYAIVQRIGVVEAVQASVGFRLAQSRTRTTWLDKSVKLPEWREYEETMILKWEDVSSITIL